MWIILFLNMWDVSVENDEKPSIQHNSLITSNTLVKAYWPSCNIGIKWMFNLRDWMCTFKWPSIAKMANARFTIVPLKASSNQVWIRCSCFCFFNLLIFICDFYEKMTIVHLLLIRNTEKIHKINTFLVRNMTLSSTFLIR